MWHNPYGVTLRPAGKAIPTAMHQRGTIRRAGPRVPPRSNPHHSATKEAQSVVRYKMQTFRKDFKIYCKKYEDVLE